MTGRNAQMASLPSDDHHPTGPASQRNLVDEWDSRYQKRKASVHVKKWATWLTLSAVPLIGRHAQPLRELPLSNGYLENRGDWPQELSPRIYVCFSHREGPVYVGQTIKLTMPERISRHFGNLRLDEQRKKASLWDFVVTASFDDLRVGELDDLENRASKWMLPRRYRRNRRYPRLSRG